jgi:Sulfotransferase family
MELRGTAPSGHQTALPQSTGPAATRAAPETAARPVAASGSASDGRLDNGPVILLSYAHSGAPRVQDLLAAGTGLACTAGTGIIPLCALAAETWRRVERRDEYVMSRLAAAAVRGLVTTQVTVILADTGKTRWCELATADPSTVQRFLEIFPQAVFVCVHRKCLEVIRAGVAASPWGLHGQGLGHYLLSYPGNSVAALAAHWASATEELLEFESANPLITRRIRYEDATAQHVQALTTLREWLGLDSGRDEAFLEQVTSPEPGSVSTASATNQPEIPLEMIPPPLRQRISRLYAELGYAPLPR